MSKKKVLGRDLAALLGEMEHAEEKTKKTEELDHVREIELFKIVQSPHQPRKNFDEEGIKELAKSIKTGGLIQPILLRYKDKSKDEYELIAGERRWRAAREAGLERIPALIRQIDDKQAAVVALLENVQRKDLNAYEQALALKELLEKFSYTQQGLSDRLGIPRASLANLLRLLNLSDPVLRMLRENILETGHAKVLLGLPLNEQKNAAQIAVSRHLNVRQVEQLVKRLKRRTVPAKKETSDVNILALQEDISDALGVAVAFSHRKDGGGKFVIHYSDLSELERIFKTLKLKNSSKDALSEKRDD